MDQLVQTAIFKYNNGNGALLCSNCRIIIKTGREISMYPQYCSNCLRLVNEAKIYAKIDPSVNPNSYEERYYNNNVDKYDGFMNGANSDFVNNKYIQGQIQILKYIINNKLYTKEDIQQTINTLKESNKIYKTERKTHPSFLRGWDVSDKCSD